jgi:hypothetical protein
MKIDSIRTKGFGVSVIAFPERTKTANIISGDCLTNH